MTDTSATTRVVATATVLLPGTSMIAVTFGLARYGYGLLLPDMKSDLGIGPGTAGLISSLGYLAYLVANAAVVPLASRLGTRVAVAGAAASAAAGMGVIAVAHHTWAVAAGVLVAGAAAGMAFPPYADIVDRHVDAPRRAVVWSTISSGTGWGVALAGPVAILAGDQWRVAWASFVVIAVVAGVAATRLAPPKDDVPLRRPQLSPSWFLCPRSRPLLLSAVLVGAGSSVWWVFSVDAMQDAGIAATPARVVYAVCGAAMLLGSASGIAFDRLGLRPSYLGSIVLLAVSLGLLGVATADVAAALVAAALFGGFYAAVIAAHGVWSAKVFDEHPAAGLAAVSTALTLGTLAGPVLAGLAIDRSGYPLALAGAAVISGLALPFCPPDDRRRVVLDAHADECTAAPVRA
ncbi:MFS transporter [Nocardioides sp. YIM 152315]|uniref:MFS transporter n=1 Tax=Nocardioides sp. YIM 152315 TaxID=3031760 RepID=UPI0023D9DC90|nr:MFS transporter [Nocardioides sp. YIM 152315]MDF1604744.1 MFS transporter [Nocardioides sp. YIM 152315]